MSKEQKWASVTPGEALRELRELHGWSQVELAKRSGVDQTTISAFESGRKAFGPDRAVRLAEALNVHPAVLIFPDWTPPSERKRAPKAPTKSPPVATRPNMRRPRTTKAAGKKVSPQRPSVAP
jgi:transcriptional regulator with XRE-family HTH domain